ncbi:siderophore-interacting protein [Gephyromycinifex aptenodytis]|uniref:siderophore-interacting protein n=1 Tax=Gephyromycinifex aptenodytis TaxID=2716227 RepID=UPI0014455FFA|nr:siderophore-interacting protein [Gephyromycinifex aptenodytis]
MSIFIPRHYEPLQDTGKLAAYYFDLRPRRITVTGTTRLSQRMVRIHFTGSDLDDLPTVSAQDHVKLFFDVEGTGQAVLPEIVEGRWSPADYTFRDYTIRFFDPQALRLDIDFVLHGHGVAGTWAANARPGDELGMLGPRGAFLLRDVRDWYVFACDETALPAAARWIEGLRAGVPVTAYIEVQDAGDEIAIDTQADLTIHWLHRGDAEPGTATLLQEAVRGHALPEGDGFCWVAGEAMSIKPLRRYLSRESGLEREGWDVDGYWRRGVANLDHHIEDTDD